MLDDDELMYTRILNHNATPDEITEYIDKLQKEIEELKERNEFLRDLRDRLIATIKDDYIEKQKIKDKIEELKEMEKTSLTQISRDIARYKYEILELLLEE